MDLMDVFDYDALINALWQCYEKDCGKCPYEQRCEASYQNTGYRRRYLLDDASYVIRYLSGKAPKKKDDAVHAKWTHGALVREKWIVPHFPMICSACGSSPEDGWLFYYCPHCGAKMVSGDDSEEASE